MLLKKLKQLSQAQKFQNPVLVEREKRWQARIELNKQRRKNGEKLITIQEFCKLDDFHDAMIRISSPDEAKKLIDAFDALKQYWRSNKQPLSTEKDMLLDKSKTGIDIIRYVDGCCWCPAGSEKTLEKWAKESGQFFWFHEIDFSGVKNLMKHQPKPKRIAIEEICTMEDAVVVHCTSAQQTATLFGALETLGQVWKANKQPISVQKDYLVANKNELYFYHTSEGCSWSPTGQPWRNEVKAIKQFYKFDEIDFSGVVKQQPAQEKNCENTEEKNI